MVCISSFGVTPTVVSESSVRFPFCEEIIALTQPIAAFSTIPHRPAKFLECAKYTSDTQPLSEERVANSWGKSKYLQGIHASHGMPLPLSGYRWVVEIHTWRQRTDG